jgi:hypothetical protein
MGLDYEVSKLRNKTHGYEWNGILPMGAITKHNLLKRSVQSSLTPYILEERELRVTQMDIFSRLMMDRIIWLAGPVNDRMSTVVQAQLLF